MLTGIAATMAGICWYWMPNRDLKAHGVHSLGCGANLLWQREENQITLVYENPTDRDIKCDLPLPRYTVNLSAVGTIGRRAGLGVVYKWKETSFDIKAHQARLFRMDITRLLFEEWDDCNGWLWTKVIYHERQCGKMSFEMGTIRGYCSGKICEWR
ncbi:MAG: hypothetical protein AMXMBFR81_08950 [Chthonomonas sp.]